MTIEMIILIIILAFIFEIVDTGLGGGYGTILTPLLLILAFNRLDIVPAILFSEIFTGITGASMHHFLNNADFSEKTKKNWKIFGLMSSLGITATIIAAFITININKTIIDTYIGILVLSMGLLMLLKIKYTFSWKKMAVIGVLSSVNKSISGGGFGPLMTAGQVVSGRDTKNAIATALLCEFPICVAGLCSYLFLKGYFDMTLAVFLTLGAIPGSIFGAYCTKKIKNQNLFKQLTGAFIIVLGAFVLLKTWNIIFP